MDHAARKLPAPAPPVHCSAPQDNSWHRDFKFIHRDAKFAHHTFRFIHRDPDFRHRNSILPCRTLKFTHRNSIPTHRRWKFIRRNFIPTRRIIIFTRHPKVGIRQKPAKRAFSLPNLKNQTKDRHMACILEWMIGFNAKTQSRKAAKRQRKLAGDNVPGEREKRIASRSDDGKCAMIPPSLQDGFYFGRCNPARCAGLISGCPCRDERGAGRAHEAGRGRKSDLSREIT